MTDIGPWPFVVWMLGWPVADAVSDYLYHLRRKGDGREPPTDNAKAFVALASMVQWVWLAVVLWRAA